VTRNVVITGRGAVTPAGIGVDTLWSAVQSGRSCVTREDFLEVEGLPIAPVSARCRAEDFAVLGNRHPERRSASEALLWDAVDQALVESGEHRARATVLLTTQLPESGFEWPEATSYGDALRATGAGADRAAQLRAYAERPVAAREGVGTPWFVDLARKLGPELRVVPLHATCATGLRLVCEAVRLIRLGRCDRAVVAVLSRNVDALHVTAFARALALSRWDGAPQAASRPFDQRRSGFVFGEAAGALVIEAEDVARARGASSFGRLLGWGLATNLEHFLRTSFKHMVRVMREALQRSELEPARIDLLDAMGSSSMVGDADEARAVYRVFGDDLSRLRVCADKAVLGYSSQAAAIVELIAATCALRDGCIPPVPTCESQESGLELPIAKAPQRAPIGLVMKNAFGMGGHYASLVMAHPELGR
jgi:3-oxoacyl-[acyl-carrier-protein] synthase II